METLGSLIDKLTIVRLKQYHTKLDAIKQNILRNQEELLIKEIDEFINNPPEILTFPSNKVYTIDTKDVRGTFGYVISMLAEINCRIWHEQEKIYNFEKVPVSEHVFVIKLLATLNLERTNCIDWIDKEFEKYVQNNR